VKILVGDTSAQELATIGGLCLVWLIIFFAKGERDSETKWNSISLVETYRKFAIDTVKRVRKGALGSSAEGMVICVDELDKITEIDDLVAFVKVLKPLLDIDGVTYYCSIAEDAFNLLRLGNVSGKDIFDSCFDHIERVPPLEFEAAAAIASGYLKSSGAAEVSPSFVNVVCLLSFGIPRDILRQCEELKAANFENALALVLRERTEKVGAAHAAGIIGNMEKTLLLGLPRDVAAQMPTLLRDTSSQSRVRLLAYVSILTKVEADPGLLDQQRRRDLLGLYEFGYEIPLLSASDVLREVFRGQDQAKGMEAVS
jgi:hypothetical protein